MLDRALLVALQLSLPPETLPLVLIAAGLGLSVLEALAPGAHFVVLGVALLAAGLVGLVVGPLASPIVLGVLVVVFGALALYGYREFDFYGGKGAGRTSDSASLRGRTGRVTERVTPTEGEVKLDEGGFNPHYAARSVSGEIPEGTEVVVVDPGGGNVVTVESMAAAYDEIDRELERGRTGEQSTATDPADTESRRTDSDPSSKSKGSDPTSESNNSDPASGSNDRDASSRPTEDETASGPNDGDTEVETETERT